MSFITDLEQLLSHIDQLEHQPDQSNKPPTEINTHPALTLPLDPTPHEQIMTELKELLTYTPSTARNDFFNQLFGGREDSAVLGDMLASYINSSMYTYKVAGIQVLVEKTILEDLCSMSGYPEGGGLFVPGGSMANICAILLGRDNLHPEIQQKGVCKSLRVYVSEACHYSVEKGVTMTGIGVNNLRKIAVNDNGQMNTDKLAEAIEEDLASGSIPLMVIATSGTTVQGCYDDLDAISTICQSHNLWLHVDGAFGGAVIFTDKQKDLLNGLSQADSFSLNFHKLLGVPQQSTALIVKDHRSMNVLSEQADYLLQTDLQYNPASQHILCGRRNDVLKVWCLWKKYGKKGLGEKIEKQFALAQAFAAKVSATKELELHSPPSSVTVCFNRKGKDPKEICKALYEKGLARLSYGSLRGKYYLRQVCVNVNNPPSSYDKLIQDILNLP